MRLDAFSLALFLENTVYLNSFYTLLLSDKFLPTLNLIIPWFCIIAGACIFFGLMTRLASTFTALLMLVFFVPTIGFLHFGNATYFVDMYLLYALYFLLLSVFHSGEFIGIDSFLSHD